MTKAYAVRTVTYDSAGHVAGLGDPVDVDLADPITAHAVAEGALQVKDEASVPVQDPILAAAEAALADAEKAAVAAVDAEHTS